MLKRLLESYSSYLHILFVNIVQNCSQTICSLRHKSVVYKLELVNLLLTEYLLIDEIARVDSATLIGHICSPRVQITLHIVATTRTAVDVGILGVEFWCQDAVTEQAGLGEQNVFGGQELAQ